MIFKKYCIYIILSQISVVLNRGDDLKVEFQVTQKVWYSAMYTVLLEVPNFGEFVTLNLNKNSLEIADLKVSFN